MPNKDRVANKISDIKPVKVGVNGADHLLDDTENQNLDKPIANEGEDTPDLPLDSQHEAEETNAEPNIPDKDEPVKNVAGTKIIAPLEKTDAEIEKANNTPVEVVTTQLAENNDINYGHPDSSQKMTSNLSENMQSPKFFDTKEYHLPISQSKHSHGFLVGSIVAGILFAVVVAGVALVVLTNLNK